MMRMSLPLPLSLAAAALQICAVGGGQGGGSRQASGSQLLRFDWAQFSSNLTTVAPPPGRTEACVADGSCATATPHAGPPSPLALPPAPLSDQLAAEGAGSSTSLAEYHPEKLRVGSTIGDFELVQFLRNVPVDAPHTVYSAGDAQPAD
jgi:hypothetical protein